MPVDIARCEGLPSTVGLRLGAPRFRHWRRGVFAFRVPEGERRGVTNLHVEANPMLSALLKSSNPSESKTCKQTGYKREEREDVCWS